MNRQQRRAAGAKSRTISGKPPASTADALVEAGLNHFHSGRIAEAMVCSEQALAKHPELPGALHLMGVIAIELQKFDQAVQLIIRAIKQNPQTPAYFVSLGSALQHQGRYDEALAIYDKALLLQPDHAEGWSKLASALQKLGRYDEALLSYDKAISISPDSEEALSNSARLLFEMNRLNEALERFDRSIALRPEDAVLLQNRGLTLQKLTRYDEALSDYTHALALNPDLPEALNNFGVILEARGQYGEALQYFDRAIKLHPRAEYYFNRANSLQQLNRPGEVLACFDQALALNPGYAETHFNEGIFRLLTGDFDGGWIKREWRWKCAAHALSNRTFAKPLWLGKEPIEGKTILLYSDEGFGDAIHFCRYVPLLADRGAKIILEVEEALRELLAGVAGVSMCLIKGAPLIPDYDFQCPISSLPLAFQTRLETIPSTVPYLFPPTDTQKWRALLGNKAAPKIGIAWSGNPKNRNDHNRSIPLSAWTPILESHATFISLQKQVRTQDAEILKERGNVLNFDSELETFADTAALISCLDLVITVDTSVAHLAGALGRPVWIMLPFIPDWRWLLDREDSPWYPTARLFRQSDAREWPSVLKLVRSALDQWMAAR